MQFVRPKQTLRIQFESQKRTLLMQFERQKRKYSDAVRKTKTKSNERRCIGKKRLKFHLVKWIPKNPQNIA